MINNYMLPVYRSIVGYTILGQIESVRIDDEGVLYFLHSPGAGASLLDGLASHH